VTGVVKLTRSLALQRCARPLRLEVDRLSDWPQGNFFRVLPRQLLACLRSGWDSRPAGCALPCGPLLPSTATTGPILSLMVFFIFVLVAAEHVLNPFHHGVDGA
jgi:hypothetical protein